MPRKRVLKTNRTVISYFNGTYSTRRAAIVYGIKRSTLQSRIKNILKKRTKEKYLRKHLENHNDSGNESEADNDSPKYSSKYTVRQVFTNEEEDELEKYIKRCSDINFWRTYTDI
ncbi:hypothetical protein ILUMI_12853 [Ignelater luminosus]|uniref:HTH psq-type domain-containing protein n=1 Tax=Ignelater luminosus TaxID=2038154 RepID=A0A8K0D1Z9_IGNLU|nr:hypothetical protein ILUMI_12853 [Ignelater luminosus]